MRKRISSLEWGPRGAGRAGCWFPRSGEEKVTGKLGQTVRKKGPSEMWAFKSLGLLKKLKGRLPAGLPVVEQSRWCSPIGGMDPLRQTDPTCKTSQKNRWSGRGKGSCVCQCMLEA